MIITRDEIKEAVKEAMAESHHCIFSEEERGLLRDLIHGAKYFKISVILSLVAGLLYVTAKVIIK